MNPTSPPDTKNALINPWRAERDSVESRHNLASVPSRGPSDVVVARLWSELSGTIFTSTAHSPTAVAETRNATRHPNWPVSSVAMGTPSTGARK